MSNISKSEKQLLRFAGRHCVAVVFEDSDGSEGRANDGFAFSGFILSVRGLWFLVSAGHIVDDINKRLSSGRYFRTAKIVDFWTENPVDRHAVPFPEIVDGEKVPQGHMNQESTGIDYAWFYLRDYYRQQLEANGIVPLGEGAWRDVPSSLDAYNAFGFLNDSVVVDRDGNGAYRGLKLKPTLIPYTSESNPPVEAELNFQRIFFWPDKAADGTFTKLGGMSGGPVFGYRIDDQANARLWLVGVQSSQLPSGLAAVCPAEPFARSFEEAMIRVIAERALSSEKNDGVDRPSSAG